MTRYRVSMDIGGTFTDVVAYDEQARSYTAGKSSTTPPDLTEGVFAALEQVVASPERHLFCRAWHDAGLERVPPAARRAGAAARHGGAGDVYHIARGHRMRLYDLHYRKPRRARARAATSSRSPADWTTPARSARRSTRRPCAGRQAVSGTRVSSRSPSLSCSATATPRTSCERRRSCARSSDADVSLSLSHARRREWREYERTSSTVLDAYTGPMVRHYLQHLESADAATRGLHVTLHVMQSSGGMVSAAARTRRDAADAAVRAGRRHDGRRRPRSAARAAQPDLCRHGRHELRREPGRRRPARRVHRDRAPGLPLALAARSTSTRSGPAAARIAYEEAGGLRVGPESAGAEPGPACYGRGGTRPTVTDANVVLGRIDPSWFAGGRMTLDIEAARAAVASLGESFGLDPTVLAEGICDVVNAKMGRPSVRSPSKRA